MHWMRTEFSNAKFNVTFESDVMKNWWNKETDIETRCKKFHSSWKLHLNSGFYRYIEAGVRNCDIIDFDVELNCNHEWWFVKVLTHLSGRFFIRIQFDKGCLKWRKTHENDNIDIDISLRKCDRFYHWKETGWAIRKIERFWVKNWDNKNGSRLHSMHLLVASTQ